MVKVVNLTLLRLEVGRLAGSLKLVPGRAPEEPSARPSAPDSWTLVSLRGCRCCGGHRGSRRGTVSIGLLAGATAPLHHLVAAVTQEHPVVRVVHAGLALGRDALVLGQRSRRRWLMRKMARQKTPANVHADLQVRQPRGICRKPVGRRQEVFCGWHSRSRGVPGAAASGGVPAVPAGQLPGPASSPPPGPWLAGAPGSRRWGPPRPAQSAPAGHEGRGQHTGAWFLAALDDGEAPRGAAPAPSASRHHRVKGPVLGHRGHALVSCSPAAVVHGGCRGRVGPWFHVAAGGAEAQEGFLEWSGQERTGVRELLGLASLLDPESSLRVGPRCSVPAVFPVLEQSLVGDQCSEPLFMEFSFGGGGDGT